MPARLLRELVFLAALSASGCTSGGEYPSGDSAGTGDEGGAGGGAADSADALRLPFAVTAHYVPTGFMGDGVQGKALLMDTTCTLSTPTDAQGDCFRFKYLPAESTLTGWAGLYFQNEPDNWGSSPGQPIASGAHRVSFYAASSEALDVEFVVGGIGNASSKYQDGFKVSQVLNVDTEFMPFEIDLRGHTYGSVLGAFGFVISKKDTSGREVALYLDGIVWH